MTVYDKQRALSELMGELLGAGEFMLGEHPVIEMFRICDENCLFYILPAGADESVREEEMRQRPKCFVMTAEEYDMLRGRLEKMDAEASGKAKALGDALDAAAEAIVTYLSYMHEVGAESDIDIVYAAARDVLDGRGRHDDMEGV